MTATIHKLEVVEVGDGYRIDPDVVLDAAKGRVWHRLMVIGQLEDEEAVYVAGTANAGETLILMELAKLQIINA